MASLLFNTEEVRKAAEIEFTNAFNKQRVVLAGFAKCNTKEELHIVRDGFYLGMCRHLRLPLYNNVKETIIKDMKVAAASGTPGSFEQTIQSARSAPDFDKMIKIATKKRRIETDNKMFLELLKESMAKGRNNMFEKIFEKMK